MTDSTAKSIKAQLNHEGLVSTALRAGDYPGAKAMTFFTKWGFNRWFDKRNSTADMGSHSLLVDLQYTPWLFGLACMVHVLVHRQLSSEDLRDWDEIQQEANVKLNERKAKRALQQEEDRKVQAAAANELQRLANVGTEYEKRVAHIKTGLRGQDAEAAMKVLNKGDPEILFATKTEAYQAGYASGYGRRDTK